MVRNYIKIAWRNLLKNRFFSLLNILGLAVSLAIAILLGTYGRQQLSFDKQFKQKDNIYRVLMETTAEYNYEKWSSLPNAVGPAMLSDIPEVNGFARLVSLDFTGYGSIRANNNNFVEKNIFLTDSSFFDLLDIKFIEGNSTNAFQHPKSVVISVSKKEKMFGDQLALNKQLIINQRDTFTVSGVFQDLPENSSFVGDILLDIMDSWMGKNVYWANASYNTFCLLNTNSDPVDIEKKATALIDKYVPKDNQYYTRFQLQPLSKIHLYSEDLRDTLSSRKGSIHTVRTVLILSALIIFIACINYMNLATARSQKNAKEVGINKVLGANRRHIKLRFYLETAIISFFSILLGFGLAVLTLPTFNTIIGTEVSTTVLFSIENMGILVVVWFLITLVGGSYPASMMASISSLSLMKNIVIQSRIAQVLRKGLVVFQFTCSIVLIIGVVIISLQMRHVSEKDLGYQSSNILVLPIRSINNLEKLNSIKQSVLSLVGTESISMVQSYPGFGESGKSVYRPGNNKEGLPTLSSSSQGAIVPTLRLNLLAGKDLPKDIAEKDDVCYVLVNEVVSSYLGYSNPDDAIGQRITTEMSTNSIITGVVRNFNFASLKENIGGYMYYHMQQPNEGYRYLLVRYNPTATTAYVAQIQKIFEQQLPDAAFDYQFLDEHIKSYYTIENRTNKIITTFSLLTIFIACLGLFGLAAFTAEQRKKEIGIRKVLGANLYKIIRLLSTHFLGLILIAFLISTPIAWWLFSRWLQDFNDRVNIPWWSFAVAGLFALVIALLTVGYQALKAARTNPINSLKDE